MRTILQQFDFKGNDVRIVMQDSEPMWVAKDVATALGYKDPTNAIKAHCRGVAKHHPIQDRLGRTQKARIISEPDLYRLIVGSDLDTAQEFERLVFEEILPSVRKRGGYLTPEATEKALTDPDFIIRLATELKEEQSKRKELEEKRAIDAPKVEYHDRFISEDSDVFTIDDWAAQYGLCKGEGLRLLRDKKIIYRKAVTSEFSKKKEELVERLEHRAYVRYRQLFDLRPQLKAPRYNNGQMRQTLYVKVACSTQLAHLAGITTTPLEGI